MNHLQALIAKALEAANWTIEDEGYEGYEDLQAVTAYSFDGTINAYGYIKKDGVTVIHTPYGPSQSYDAVALLTNLVELATKEDAEIAEGR